MSNLFHSDGGPQCLPVNYLHPELCPRCHRPHLYLLLCLLRKWPWPAFFGLYHKLWLTLPHSSSQVCVKIEIWYRSCGCPVSKVFKKVFLKTFILPVCLSQTYCESPALELVRLWQTTTRICCSPPSSSILSLPSSSSSPSSSWWSGWIYPSIYMGIWKMKDISHVWFFVDHVSLFRWHAPWK